MSTSKGKEENFSKSLSGFSKATVVFEGYSDLHLPGSFRKMELHWEFYCS